MATTPEKIIRAAFVALLLILLSVGLLAYRSTATLMSAAQDIRHAQNVQTDLWELLAGINTAEISQGRFVMTSDERALSGLDAARPKIVALENALRKSIASDRVQLIALDRLQTLINRRIEVAQELVALRRSAGFDAAIKRIAAGETTQLQTQIRNLIDSMTAAQEAVITSLEAEALKTARRTGAILILGGVLAVGAVLCALLFADSNLSARTMAAREKRLELALASARLGIWDWDLRNGKIVWSGVHEQLWGIPVGSFTGDYAEFERRILADDRLRVRESVDHALKTQTEYNAEYRIVWPDGSIHWIAGRGQAIYDGDIPIRMTGVVADITERHTAEVARESAQSQLQANEARLRGILDSMLAFVGLLTLEGKVVEVNRGPLAAAGLRREDVIGVLLAETYWGSHSIESQTQVRDAISRAASGETVRGEFTIRIRDDELIVLDGVFAPILDNEGRILQIVCSGVDITARKQAEAMRQKLEAQLWQAQKMEALGTLAGGVAHDFNNILSAIVGNAELARQDIDATHPAAASIAEIRKASQRAKFLVQQILAFSRKQSSERVAISLKSVVMECTTMLRAILPANVELSVHCSDQCPSVLADANQIHQVLLNLGTNAWQALPPHGGRIQVHLEPMTIESDLAPLHANLHAGRYACIRVSDNGNGMNEDLLARIFEPFFTTKAVGEGTGLGLSVVDGIMKSHDGAIRVTSKPGVGSTFELFFPAIEGTTTQASTTAASAATGSGQSIVYLDDDEALVSLTTKLLKRNGYQAIGFTTPADALAAIRDLTQPIDLLVTDFNMPGTSGIQVVKQAKQVRPQLPVILASGYVTDDLRLRAREVGVHHVVSKPQTVTELCEIVHRTLKERGA